MLSMKWILSTKLCNSCTFRFCFHWLDASSFLFPAFSFQLSGNLTRNKSRRHNQEVLSCPKANIKLCSRTDLIIEPLLFCYISSQYLEPRYQMTEQHPNMGILPHEFLIFFCIRVKTNNAMDQVIAPKAKDQVTRKNNDLFLACFWLCSFQ